MRIRLACLAAALLLFASLTAGADYQPVPLLEGRIVDKANMLSGAERERLAALLASYERETTHQIAVLTVPGLSGETIESFRCGSRARGSSDIAASTTASSSPWR